MRTCADCGFKFQTPDDACPRCGGAPLRTSRLAVAVLIASICAPPFAAAFLAVGPTAWQGAKRVAVISTLTLILSLVALVRITRSRGRLRGGAIAVTGILLSASFMYLEVTTLYVAFSSSHQALCYCNLEQVTLAVRMYAADNDDTMPPATGWSDAALRKAITEVIFHCPEAPRLRSAYAFNRALAGRRLKTIPHPDRTVLLFESDLGWNGAGGREALVARPRHRGKDVFAFADGHAASLDRKQESGLIWNP